MQSSEKDFPTLPSTTVIKNESGRLTRKEKQAHVSACLASGKTHQAYCEEHGLKITSFKNWRLRYDKRQPNHFKRVITASALTTSTGLCLEITKRSSKVVINNINDTSLIVRLIKEVF